MGLSVGKVPPKILERTVFKSLGFRRSDVLVSASEGEDAAIIRSGNKLLAFHCDPISGAYKNIGWIAMNIATNDIATRGVKPCWVLSCIMLPIGSSERILGKISEQMDDAAKRLGVSIVGGHSEITLGLDHPIVMVSVLGVIERERYVTTSGAKPGCKIILTKSVGIEGTAILASDRKKLLSKRLGKDLINRAERHFDQLSILKEALTAFNYGGVVSMHDPTEGGLAGGLNEISDASKTGFKVYEDKIAISQETSKICNFFRIDPLSLISSGALLIIASPVKAHGILRRLEEEGVQAAVIGDILNDVKRRTIIRRNGVEENFQMPLNDELWKALALK